MKDKLKSMKQDYNDINVKKNEFAIQIEELEIKNK